MPPRIPREEEDEIVRLYTECGLSSHVIATQIERANWTVLDVLRRRGVEKRSPSRKRGYEVRDDFFREIDTDDKAYWLGFLAADGCVYQNAGQYRNEVCVGLSRVDRLHLDKLREAVGGPAVREFTDKDGCEKSELRWSSPAMVADLAKQGVSPRKSLTMEPWAGPPEMLPAFYRGLIDGDGWWTHKPRDRKRADYQTGLVATRPVATAFRKFVRDRTGAKPSAFHSHPQSPVMWYVRYGRLTAIQAIARLLYDGASVWLDRKREKAERILAMPLTHLNRSVTH